MSKEVAHYYNIYKRRDNQVICQTSGFTNDPIKIIEKKAKRYISPLVQLTVPELKKRKETYIYQETRYKQLFQDRPDRHVYEGRIILNNTIVGYYDYTL